MTLRFFPLLALVFLTSSAPSLALAAQSKAQAKSKKKQQAPPAKQADPEPADAFEQFINAPSSAAPSEPEPEPEPEPRDTPRVETRQVEAVPADLPPPENEEPRQHAAAQAAPEPSRNWWGRTVGHAGAYLTLGFGYNWWSLDRSRVTDQVLQANPTVDTSSFFDASLQNGIAGSLRGGYNVLGHAHVGFNFLATGWNIDSRERGGAGYIGGEIGWHPLSLVSALLPGGALPFEKYYDFFLEGGAGYGIVGKNDAMDGGIGSFGLGLEGYPAPWVSIGIRSTWYFPFFNHYILDYDARNDPGNTIDLPQGSGGSFLTFNGYLAFHFGTPEK